MDLKFFVRGFVAKLTGCHEEIRNATKTFFDGELEILRQANETLSKHKGEESKYVSLIAQHEGKTVDELHINYSNYSKLCEFRKSWTGLKYIQRSYVSSEITIAKDTYPQKHPAIWLAT